ncbi:MAG: class I SAM-dependent methyltransferase [Bacillus subtilis]|nr:class I SAM-dependent methyltransferase [Bacillus subtilis]
MRLSLRLQTALDLCGNVESLIDIGTDHAFLPIAAIEQGLAKQAIAVDNKRGPIEKAYANIHRHHLDTAIRLVLADGLEGLDRPIQAGFLLGMGGITIATILAVPELRFIETLILGPNSEDCRPSSMARTPWLEHRRRSIRRRTRQALSHHQSNSRFDAAIRRSNKNSVPILTKRRDPALYQNDSTSASHA